MDATRNVSNKPTKGGSTREDESRIVHSKKRQRDIDRSIFEQRPTKLRRSQRLAATQPIDAQGADNQQLCGRCQRIDFETIFNNQRRIPPLNGLPILELGNLSTAIKTPRCRLCRLFIAMRFPKSSSRGRKKGYHLRAFSSAAVFSEEGPRRQVPDIVLSVFHGQLRRDIYPWERWLFSSEGFIAPAVDNIPPMVQNTFFRASQVFPNKVNYQQIQGWLDHCQESHDHDKTCGERSAMRIPLKCIDCFSRNIVEITLDDLYLALSYVWGTPRPETSSPKSKDSVKRLQIGIPQVIEDAMTVVKSLGKRYLWVDKYCIDQHDVVAKHYQIQNMDRIYQGAHATIVASAGTDALSGLPGVGSVPRKWQPSSFIGKSVLRSTLPPLKDILGRTTWITRGWTYQEAALSRRCLFFTELQVYFVCSAMSCSEAIATALSSVTTLATSAPGVLSAGILGKTTDVFDYNTLRTPLRQFADHITQYTGRNLTYEMDIMNAFRGLLAKSQFHNYYGIPIAPSDWEVARSPKDFDYGFARGLFWMSNYNRRGGHISLSRRENFPSWSWVGWKGVAMFPGSGSAGSGYGREALMEIDKSTFSSRFWIIDKHGKRFTLAQLCASESVQKLVPEISNYIEIESWVLRFRFQPSARNHSEFDICRDPDLGKVTFFEKPLTKNDELYTKVVSQSWSCVLLFKSVGCAPSFEDLYNFLILEWHGEVAQRVGSITVRGNSEKLDSLPRKRQRIVLG